MTILQQLKRFAQMIGRQIVSIIEFAIFLLALILVTFYKFVIEIIRLIAATIVMFLAIIFACYSTFVSIMGDYFSKNSEWGNQC